MLASRCSRTLFLQMRVAKAMVSLGQVTGIQKIEPFYKNLNPFNCVLPYLDIGNG